MEPRAPKKDEWMAIDRFLRDQLRPEQDWSLRSEYPLAFSESNIGNIRIICDEQDQLLSHAVLKTSLIKTPYQLWKAGFIGSVCTNPEAREQGLGAANINSCLEAASQQNCDFVMLWTNLFNYYSKFGFQVAGTEIAVNLPENFSPETTSQTENFRILQSRQISAQSLLDLYNRHSLKTLRSTEDIRKCMQIPNSDVFTAWNPVTNRLCAYAVIGKGADFENYVHEWGGDVSAILQLLAEIRRQRQSLTIIMPPECQNLRRQLKKWGGQEAEGILGMIRLASPKSFMKKIKKGARAQGFDSFIFEYRDGMYYFGVGDEVYQTDSQEDIVRLAFGPLPPSEIHDFSQKALEVLERVFPLSFWVWGWDSI